MPMYIFSLFLLILNILAYLLMWIDKLRSIYQWWRVSERTFWILALLGGVFAIWLGMYAPLYHKAGKQKFKLWIPVIGMVWTIIFVFLWSGHNII